MSDEKHHVYFCVLLMRQIFRNLELHVGRRFSYVDMCIELSKVEREMDRESDVYRL